VAPNDVNRSKRTNPYDDLQVLTLVNAAGPVTRYGGSCLNPRVLKAMEEATHSYVRLDELQLAAGRRLAEWTGAEAGYITTGAAAGLTLGAAALMAGLDVDRMDRLPDTTGFPNEFILQECHLSDYDHCLRASGARLRTVTCEVMASVEGVRDSIRSVLTEKTCATAYVFRTNDRGVSLEIWVRASKSMGLPILVDASVRLPPVENLRRIPATGADLVAFSGGKAVGGPQGTGFVVGRRDLVESVLLQNQDMDVNAETWFLKDWLTSGKLQRPSTNGIGRGFKVSKENIVGLLVALEEYLQRDHQADVARWNMIIDSIAADLKEVPGCALEKVFDPGGPYPVPVCIFRLTDEARLSLVEFVNGCSSHKRPVLFEEGPLEEGYLIIHPTCLSEEDASELIRTVRRVLALC